MRISRTKMIGEEVKGEIRISAFMLRITENLIINMVTEYST